MVGKATFTIVRSTMVMKYATTSRAKARQRRRVGWEPRPAAGSVRIDAPRSPRIPDLTPDLGVV